MSGSESAGPLSNATEYAAFPPGAGRQERVRLLLSPSCWSLLWDVVSRC